MLEGATISDRDQLLSDLEKSRGLPPGTLSKIWQTESGRGQNLGPSRAGARGHFGFMPGTAATYGVTNPDDFDQSATGAADYLSDLRQQFGGDMNKALAGYNWGPHRVQMATAQYGDQWATALPSETRHYLMATSDAAPDLPASYGNVNAATMNLGPWAADWQRRKAASDAPYIRSFAETQQRERELAAREQDRPDVTAGPAPQVPQPDPVRGFASAAGIFAMIASAMTHTPMVAAMSSMAAAINARNQNDMTTYEKEYKQWKEQTDQALKMDAAHRAKVQQALELMKTDFAAGQAMLNAVDTEYNDEKGMVFSLANNQIAREELNISRGRLSQEMQNHKDQLELEHDRLTQEKELREKEINLRREIFGASGKGDVSEALVEWEKKFIADNGREPTAEERLTKRSELTSATKAPTPGSPAAERTARFAEVKSAQQAAGTYKGDSGVWNAVDQQIQESKSPPMSDAAAVTAAQVALKTGHPPAWMGRNQASLTKFLNAFSDEAKRQGMNASDIAAAQVKFTSEVAQGRTLGQFSARVDFGAQELDVALPQAAELSAAVYRPGFKKAAEIVQALQGQTSDPDLLEFAQQNQQVITAYSQTMGRGNAVTTVAAMDRAKEIMATATTQEGYMRQLDRLHKEVQTILYGTEAAKGRLMNEITGRKEVPPQPTLTGVPRPKPSAADEQLRSWARDSIASGASKEKVIQRLKEWGVDTDGF